jgi:hypothetical protein
MRYPTVTSLVIIRDSLIIEWRGQGEVNRLSKLPSISWFKAQDVSIMFLRNDGTQLHRKKSIFKTVKIILLSK